MEDIETAFFKLIRTLNKRPQDTMSNYDIGVPLIGQGYSQDAIVGLLFSLKERGMIEILGDNRTKVLKLGE